MDVLVKQGVKPVLGGVGVMIERKIQAQETTLETSQRRWQLAATTKRKQLEDFHKYIGLEEAHNYSYISLLSTYSKGRIPGDDFVQRLRLYMIRSTSITLKVRIVPSSAADMMLFSSEEKETLLTLSVCP